MLKLFFLITTALASFYQLQFSQNDGQTRSMNSFAGKKVLLVNIATSSPRVTQLSGLQQLHQLYGDSLVIIAFPSNSFGNESRSNQEIAQFCQSQYGIGFMLAAKNPVIGSGLQSVYGWLADSTVNGSMNGIVQADFYKYLIDGQGEIKGVFGPSLDPMDSLIQNAITGHY